MREARHNGSTAPAAGRLVRRSLVLAGRLRRDQRGVTSVVYGIVFTFILLAAAIAVDHALLITEQARDQAAVDAAILAASDHLGLEDQETVGQEKARIFYEANRRDSAESRLASVVFDPDNSEVYGATATTWRSTLLKAFGYDTARLSSDARVKQGKADIEVVLVLDNSKDITGAPLDELKVAAKAMTRIVFTGGNTSSTIKMGIVPFAGAVNVGPDKRDAAWIDGDGAGVRHAENFTRPAGSSLTRFDLLDKLGESWGGCVEVRSEPHDVLDTPADPSNPDTLFQPMFAPDEPDAVNKGSSQDDYMNSYIVDSGGTCTPQPVACVRTNKSGKCLETAVTPIPSDQAQRQVCKYDGSTPDPNASSLGPTEVSTRGPNLHCDSKPLTPLTNYRPDIEAAIDAMEARPAYAGGGGSNVAEGIMWGFRVLSPGQPFTGGGEFNDPETKKYMILLARGDNWNKGVRDDLNHSWYSAWGYGTANRLNPNSHTTTSLENSMNETSRSACRLVTETGVPLYTIGFGVSNAHTRSMLQYCASHPHMNFSTDSGEELKAIFEAIGREIRQLRLSG